MDLKDLQDPNSHPYMVKWFNFKTLIGAAKKAFISSMFGTYADGRLVQATLDTSNEGKPITIKTAELPYLSSEEIWIDFVADVGDGFDSTYAVAYWLSQKQLTINGVTTKRGEILLMGGDQVYPTSSEEEYIRRFEVPYSYAYPKTDNGEEKRPFMFLLPGNHDWYDGLRTFCGRYCNGFGWCLGPKHSKANWILNQTRSYFALKLPMNWWVFGIDTQLTDDIDSPQQKYFMKIAEENNLDEAKIILCVSTPSWLKNGSAYDQTVEHFTTEIIKKKWGKKATIYLVLTGDLHHYSRYTLAQSKTEFITAGGGGAFLHATHQLKDKVFINWWEGKEKEELNLAIKKGTNQEKACYPSQKISSKLSWWNLLFVFKNLHLCAALGLMYTILILLLINLNSATFIPCLLFLYLFGFCLYKYTFHDDVDVSAKRKIAFFLSHLILHILGIIVTINIFPIIKSLLVSIPFIYFIASDFILNFISIFLAGSFLGGFVCGIYLTFASLFKGHTDDAFSAMGIGDYKNFVRLCLKENEIKVFPIGLAKVPARDEWIINDGSDPEVVSLILPSKDITNDKKPLFIEKPFEIPKNLNR